MDKFLINECIGRLRTDCLFDEKICMLNVDLEGYYNIETTFENKSSTAVYYTVTIMTSYLVYLRGIVQWTSDPHQYKLLE